MQARDELLRGADPILPTGRTAALTITGLYATADRDADTWGCVLLLTQDLDRCTSRGCRRITASRMPPRARAAQLAMPPFRKMSGIPWQTWARSSAMSNATPCIRWKGSKETEKRLRKHWDEAVFAQLVQADAEMTALLIQSQRLRGLRGALWGLVELVDWRTGDIRARAINQWLAEEVLREMRQLPHPRIQKLAERLAAILPRCSPSSTSWPPI